MPLRFHRASSSSIRDIIAKGLLPELEYGLLKTHGDKLRWSVADRSLFCDMVVDVLEVQKDRLKLQVIVRSFCHARDVVSDFLKQDERFNTKRSILLIGDVGLSPAPWANLIQPALSLHADGFNVINIEIPEFMFSTPRYLKYGPAIISGVLKHMAVANVCTLACGNGGALLFETLAQYRSLFGPSHFLFNLDCPPGTKKAPFPLVRLEEHLREGSLQFWLGFNEEEGVYSRFDNGTPRKSYEAITGMQVRLEGERRRGRRSLDFDEVLITDQLAGSPKAPNVKRLALGRNCCHVYAPPLLESLFRFFVAHSPSQTQDNLVSGLVPDMKLFGQMKPGEPLPELPAMAVLRLKANGEGDGDQLMMMQGETHESFGRSAALGQLEQLFSTALADGDSPASGSRGGGGLRGGGSRGGSRGDSRGMGLSSSTGSLRPTTSGRSVSLTSRSSGGRSSRMNSLRSAGEGCVKGPGGLVQLAHDARMRPLPVAALTSEAYLRDRSRFWDGMSKDDSDEE